MTTATLTYVGSLVVTSCWCGIGHAVPKDLHRKAELDHSFGIYCPLGHSWVFSGETEAQKLKRQLTQAEDAASAARAERDQIEASRRAWKGQATRARKAVLAGQCAFCGQHLRDLERHVTRMHGDEAAKDPGAEPVA